LNEPAPTGYGEDLAYIHDAGFGELAEAGAAHLLTLFKKQATKSGTVVELGCGSGIAAAKIAAAGFEAVGIDSSPQMIEIARARNPDGDFRLGSFVDAELPPATAYLAIGEVLNYVFDDRNGPAALQDTFQRVHDALEPGGVFLFDLSGTGRIGAEPVRTWRSGGDWAVMTEAREDSAAGTLTRHILAFRDSGDGYRRSQETHLLRLYGANAVLASLAAAGLRATPMRGYDGHDFAPGHRAYLARRPKS
jgi:SAM-dependent methyltransferase